MTFTHFALEASANQGRTWKAIPGAQFRMTFADGALCWYADGRNAEQAAHAAAARLAADPELGTDLYRVVRF